MEFKDINKLIEEKAKQKLYLDIIAIAEFLKNNTIIQGKSCPLITYYYPGQNGVYDQKLETKLFWLFEWNSPFVQEIRKELLPQYITRES